MEPLNEKFGALTRMKVREDKIILGLFENKFFACTFDGNMHCFTSVI